MIKRAKRLTWKTGAAALLVGCGLAAGGWMATQPEGVPMEGGMPDMAQMLAMMDEMSKPDTAQHEVMKKLAGDWVMTAKFRMDPSAPAEVSTGTCTSRFVLGGRQLLSEVDMQMMMMGRTQAMGGIGVLGYDKATSRFVSVWMDTMSTGQMIQTGEMDGETIIVDGTTVHPLMGTYRVKNIYRFVEGGYDLEFWEGDAAPGGELMNTGVIEYRRPQKPEKADIGG